MARERAGVTDETWDGFTNAVVTIELATGRFRLEPCPGGGDDPFPFDATVHIITPYNPNGLEASAEENEGALERFVAIVAEHVTHPTVGSAPDGSMAEPGRAIENLTLDDALDLGRQFGQRAIYEWSAEALSVIGVDEPSRHDIGWRLVDLP